MNIVVLVTKRAVDKGQAGKPPMMASALIKNKSTAQVTTRVSTKIEKLRSENENSPQEIPGEKTPGGGNTIGARNAFDRARCVSAFENIESLPEIAAAENICVRIQSRKARRMRSARPENSMPPCPPGSAHDTRPWVSMRTRGEIRSKRRSTSWPGSRGPTA